MGSSLVGEFGHSLTSPRTFCPSVCPLSWGVIQIRRHSEEGLWGFPFTVLENNKEALLALGSELIGLSHRIIVLQSQSCLKGAPGRQDLRDFL